MSASKSRFFTCLNSSDSSPVLLFNWKKYGTSAELFKDQGFYSQNLYACSLEINEFFRILTASLQCLYQIYVFL